MDVRLILDTNYGSNIDPKADSLSLILKSSRNTRQHMNIKAPVTLGGGCDTYLENTGKTLDRY